MRILVCGGRNFANPKPYDHSEENKPQMDQYRFVQRTLDRIAERYSREVRDDLWLPTDIVIIEGGARGADTAARDWAIYNYAQSLTYKADWKKYPEAAGVIRNQQMLNEGKPDLIVAFPGGKGTTDMVRRAKKANIKVIEIEYESHHEIL